jgi:radical SAM superfamily enzyme YgiQ (UPF0313 family)
VRELQIAAIDACFSLYKQQNAGLSTRCVRWMLSQSKKQTCSVAEASVLFVSCQDPEQAKFVEGLRRKFRNKLIVVGGAAATSPRVFCESSDAVVIGHGRPFCDAICADGIDAAMSLPNVWVRGKTEIKVDSGFEWKMPPIETEGGQWSVSCGRGCKKKCLFCQTGWAYEYSENPDPISLLRQIKNLNASKKRVSYLSNDPAQHSFSSQLPKTDAASYSIQYIKATKELPAARQLRIGVEGISERLRRLVGKPITHVDLVNVSVWLANNGRSVRWFLLCGLPWEKTEDWEELKLSVSEWKSRTAKGVLALSLTAWMPEPATPMRSQPLVDDYYQNWLEFKEWFFGGRGWSNRVKLMQPGAPATRLEKAKWHMATSERELLSGGHRGPNCTIVNYPFEIKCQGIEQGVLAKQSRNFSTDSHR